MLPDVYVELMEDLVAWGDEEAILAMHLDLCRYVQENYVPRLADAA